MYTPVDLSFPPILLSTKFVSQLILLSAQFRSPSILTLNHYALSHPHLLMPLKYQLYLPIHRGSIDVFGPEDRYKDGSVTMTLPLQNLHVLVYQPQKLKGGNAHPLGHKVNKIVEKILKTQRKLGTAQSDGCSFTSRGPGFLSKMYVDVGRILLFCEDYQVQITADTKGTFFVVEMEWAQDCHSFWGHIVDFSQYLMSPPMAKQRCGSRNQ
mmetsp:Transcript_16808/g.27334  ORF Transcript_16808/g.27334 Transcript_16808/m.27334 type:complete len:211 (-) Transcript_16808:330-962(-)